MSMCCKKCVPSVSQSPVECAFKLQITWQDEPCSFCMSPHILVSWFLQYLNVASEELMQQSKLFMSPISTAIVLLPPSSKLLLHISFGLRCDSATGMEITHRSLSLWWPKGATKQPQQQKCNKNTEHNISQVTSLHK